MTTAGKKNRSVHVHDVLLDEIVRGVRPPGEHLVEADIARRLRVSRTPVRDALMQLAADGLVVTARGSLRVEMVVAPMDRADFLELWTLVAGVEGAALSRLDDLAPSARRTLAATLRAVNDELDGLLRSRRVDAPRYRDLQRRFHDTLVDTCGGARILAAHRALRAHVARYEVARASSPFRASRESVVEHERIIAAIERGSSAAARAAVTAHWELAAARTASALSFAAPVRPRSPRARATA